MTSSGPSTTGASSGRCASSSGSTHAAGHARGAPRRRRRRPPRLRRPTTRPRSRKRRPGPTGPRATGRRRATDETGACRARARARGHRARRAHGAPGWPRTSASSCCRAELAATGWVSPRPTTGPPATAAELPQTGRPGHRAGGRGRAARRAKAFADFEAEARALPRGVLAARDERRRHRLRLAQARAGPRRPAAAAGGRGGAATAPVPADRRGAPRSPRAAGRCWGRTTGGARTRRRGGARSRRGAGGVPHRPLVPRGRMPSIDKIGPCRRGRATRSRRPARRHGRARPAPRLREAPSLRRDEREPPGRVGRRGRRSPGCRARRGRGNVPSPLHRRGARARPMRGRRGPPAVQLALQPPRPGPRLRP